MYNEDLCEKHFSEMMDAMYERHVMDKFRDKDKNYLKEFNVILGKGCAPHIPVTE